jgi:hypothetical protein
LTAASALGVDEELLAAPTSDALGALNRNSIR